MRFFSVLMVVFSFLVARADEKMKMYFNNEEITKIIELYSKASGQKFIVDPGVRGKISIFNQEAVSLDEAFNQLSSALAVNGFGISKQGDMMIVKMARNIQRDLHEVSTERPSLKPERLYTWIYTFKNVSASAAIRDLRTLVSSNGEITSHENTNQLFLTDWVSNINRVAEILKEVDKTPDPTISKLVETAKKNREAHTHDQTAKKEQKNPKTEN